jgi:deoxyribodipyrimidine photo-lyase
MNVVIHWFRRDLRLTDNTALAAAAKQANVLVPVYIVSKWRQNHSWTGPMRQEFLCGCLASLSANLETAGNRLVIRSGEPVQALLQLAKETGADTITLNRDPDPFGREVERRLHAAAQAHGLKVCAFKDAAIHEQDEVLTATGTPFRVFTPYSKAWRLIPKPVPAAKPDLARPASTPIASEPLPTLQTWGLQKEGNIIEPGERAARQRLKHFLDGPILSYGARRNIPAGETTSRLSQDLRFGLLSIREVYARCAEISRSRDLTAAERKSVEAFISELIWREFYMAILWHYPDVLDHEFNPKFRGLPWKSRSPVFDCWAEGRTGFPIVDAGMRQLNQTGFMHNRLRMITAMFLTKDLQIDWREGEKYFMQKLVDGEIASNNGGWQWSAGTGADAAPYFRIQNPWLQSERWDADGEYIREWVPELRDMPAAKLHKAPADGSPIAKGYPAPMVDHSVERQRCMEFFAAAGVPAEAARDV